MSNPSLDTDFKKPIVRSEFKWQSSRTWNSLFPQMLSEATSINGTISQNTYWTLIENLKHLKRQDDFPWPWISTKGKRKRSGTGPAPLEEAEKENRSSGALGSPLTSKEVTWDEKSSRWKHNNPVSGRQERDLQRWSVPPSCMLQPWSTCLALSMDGAYQVLECRLQRTDPGEDCCWLCRDSLKGVKCRAQKPGV